MDRELVRERVALMVEYARAEDVALDSSVRVGARVHTLFNERAGSIQKTGPASVLVASVLGPTVAINFAGAPTAQSWPERVRRIMLESGRDLFCPEGSARRVGRTDVEFGVEPRVWVRVEFGSWVFPHVRIWYTAGNPHWPFWPEVEFNAWPHLLQ